MGIIYLHSEGGPSFLRVVPAQNSGEELERIKEKHGKIEACTIVEESRPEEAVLHPVFEWRDNVAAENYRVYQAQRLIRCLVVEREVKSESEPVQIRAFLPIHQDGTNKKDFKPLADILSSKEDSKQIIQKAMFELYAWQKRYGYYKELAEDAQEVKRILKAYSDKREYIDGKPVVWPQNI